MPSWIFFPHTVAGLATMLLQPQPVVILPVMITRISGTNVTYSGGAGNQFVLLKSEIITAPRSGWSRVATNSTTPGTFTVPAMGSGATVFYSIKSE